MTPPTMAEAFQKAKDIIGEQAVQLALLSDEVQRLRAEVAALRPAEQEHP